MKHIKPKKQHINVLFLSTNADFLKICFKIHLFWCNSSTSFKKLIYLGGQLKQRSVNCFR